MKKVSSGWDRHLHMFTFCSITIKQSSKHVCHGVSAGGPYTNSFICTTSLCHNFSEHAAYLHPFNIEFGLFSSTMLYIIWKNTGWEVSPQKSRLTHKAHFVLSGAFTGLILGALTISATIGVMIAFGVLAKSPETIPRALPTSYIFNSVLLFAMFLATLIGIITY